ncbi:MAG: radical SAM protein [Nanoarchaeota archaeon]
MTLDGREISVEDVEAAVEKNPDAESVTLTGGEGLLHPRFFEILDIVKDRRRINLLTNGIRLDGATLEKLVAYPIEIYASYNVLDEKIENNLQSAHDRGLPVNIQHVLFYESLHILDRICEQLWFAEKLLLLYPSDITKGNVNMYSPEEWFGLLDASLRKVSDIKTYFEMAFVPRSSRQGIHSPCNAGKDVFIDVDGKAYPCCLLTEIVKGDDELRPMPYTAAQCNWLRMNAMPTESEYIRICPLEFTDRFDGVLRPPARLGEYDE